ncbi:MAG: ABZJ_00895 family protein [Cyanobacteriota bacterium]|jgi:hypothetical protein
MFPLMKNDAMSVKGVLLRFFLLYTMLFITAGLLSHYFNIRQNAGVNMGILAVSVYWVCYAFGKRNGRYFSKTEKTAVVFGLASINIALQFLFTAAALSQSPTGLSAVALLFAAGLIGSLHTVVIYFFVGLAKKLLI